MFPMLYEVILSVSRVMFLIILFIFTKRKEMKVIRFKLGYYSAFYPECYCIGSKEGVKVEIMNSNKEYPSLIGGNGNPCCKLRTGRCPGIAIVLSLPQGRTKTGNNVLRKHKDWRVKGN